MTVSRALPGVVPPEAAGNFLAANMALSPVIELSGGRLEPPSVIVVQATIHSKADSSGRELCRNEDWLLSFAWRLLGSVCGFARQSLYLRLEPLSRRPVIRPAGILPRRWSLARTLRSNDPCEGDGLSRLHRRCLRHWDSLKTCGTRVVSRGGGAYRLARGALDAEHMARRYLVRMPCAQPSIVDGVPLARTPRRNIHFSLFRCDGAGRSRIVATIRAFGENARRISADARPGGRVILARLCEEGVWLAPALAFLFIVAVSVAARHSYRSAGLRGAISGIARIVGMAAIAAMVFVAMLGAVASMNYRQYGAFTTNELQSAPLRAAYGAVSAHPSR